METNQVKSKPSVSGKMSNESFITFLMIGVLIVLFGVAAVFVPNFYQPQNMLNLITNNWFIIIIGIGVTFLLITGNFDLSVGGVIAMTGVLAVYFSQAANVSQNALANGLGLPYGVAVILALIIRHFAMEAFVIPTGSMAPTLLGDHFEVDCENCGNRYALSKAEGEFTRSGILSAQSYCPQCDGENRQTLRPGDVLGGHKILVNKFIYKIRAPRRYEVIVFKFP